MSLIHRRLLVAGLAGAGLVLASGCECGEPNVGLDILDPLDGAVITLADDVNPELDDVQITVLVSARGLAVDDEVTIRVDGSPGGTARVEEDGSVRFAEVTLSGGMHTLTADAAGGAVVSEPVTVTVDSSCAMISFVTPAPPGSGSVRLGPSQDTDGEMCGTTFETTVIVSTDAGDGSDARVFVNGTPRRTAVVDGATVRFEGVALDNRGDVPNTLAVSVTRPDGVTCRADFPSEIFVDCEGVSCSIVRPATSSPYLNQFDDVSSADGFQGEFVVATDADGAGQDIQLIIDGNETDAISRSPMMVGTGAEATFGNISLSEGVHRLQAACSDAAGNRTRSGAVEWTVDITPCDIDFTAPDEGQLFIDSDDLDSGMEGIQIEAEGTIGGPDCAGLRVGMCSSIDGREYTSASDGWSARVSLGSGASQQLCADVRDDAGNVARATRAIMVRSDAPRVEIASPNTGAAYNRLGTAGRTADLDDASPTCEAEFTVYCSEVGADVTLRRNDTGATLAGGTAECVATGGLPSGYPGQAVFSSVSLPSLPALAGLEIVARQEADRLVGLSDPISVLSDCRPPTLMLQRPLCGDILRPGTQDESAAPGFQYEVRVVNSNTPKPPVILSFYDTSGGLVFTDSSSSPPTGPFTDFPDAEFNVGGELRIEACATDMAGNEGCTPPGCMVTVADLPTLTISEPTPGALGAADDCDAAAGMQIQVTAVTSATDGSTATIEIGSAPASNHTVVGGMVTACVDAPEGRDLPVKVTVNDAGGDGTISATVIVSIDSIPPDTAITNFAAVLPAVDRRAGVVRFEWTAVDDADGHTLHSYEVRCSTNGPVDSEAAWNLAAPRAIGVSPVAGATGQSADLGEFRLGLETWCAIRGADVAGQLTPLAVPPPGSITLSFETLEISGPADGDGQSVVPVGDVNGDSIDDFLVGTNLGFEAYLFFGSATGISSTPDLRIRFVEHQSFGTVVAGLGDVNGDGLGDFAVSARAATTPAGAVSGAVYVFFGRATTGAWGTGIIDVATGSCDADVCFESGEALALLGWAVWSAGDFDGDGLMDIAIGAPRGGGGDGRVYVILGDSSWLSGTGYELPGAAEPRGFYINAPSTTSYMGGALASCGDLSSDGRSDLLVGARGSGVSATAGALVRVNGAAYPAAATGLQDLSGTASILATGVAGSFGDVVLCLGDYDGDSRLDVGVWNAGGSAGVLDVYLQNGGTYSSTTSVRLTNDGPAPTADNYAYSVGIGYHPYFRHIGDLDRDGIYDLIVGSSQSGTGPGDVTLFYGVSPAVGRVRSEADVTFSPTTADTSGARSVSYIGDVNSDGFADFAIGDRDFQNGDGRVLIYY